MANAHDLVVRAQAHDQALRDETAAVHEQARARGLRQGMDEARDECAARLASAAVARQIALSSFKTIDDVVAGYDAVAAPLRIFLLKHSEPRDRQFFMRTAVRLWPAARSSALKEDDMMVLVPAYTVTELSEAFRIGFMLFLAFLIVDLAQQRGFGSQPWPGCSRG